ncbi:uncharacterized protein [Typha angustifolia]|uniref:uncharacterized protein n=1 Tax=Typha angustifolia TaxID=59011 RepID=UPI003C2E6F10
MSGEKNTSFLSSFTPDGDRFAALSPDGTIKVWDTRSGSMVADWKDPDVESAISCILCYYIGKKRKKDKRTLLIAIGTELGDVFAIDTLTGEKRWVSSKCHSSEVAALSLATKGCIVYSAGTDGVVSELNSETGEFIGKFKASKRPITSLTLSNDEKIIFVASKKSRMFSLDEKKELLNIPSDQGSVQYIAISDDGKFIVSSVSGHKQLQLWSYDDESRSITAKDVLLMQNKPMMLDCKSFNQTGSIHVLSVSEKGVAYVWHLKSTSQDGVFPSKIAVKSARAVLDGKKHGKKDRIPIVSATLCDIGEDARISVLIAYGLPDDMQFKIVEVKDNNKDIYVTAENNGESGDLDVDETTTPSQKKRVKKRAAPDSANGDVFNNLEVMPEPVAELNLDEPTMAEKLASLDLLKDEKEKSELMQESSPTVKPPSADSVHVLLKQALHADDHSLLLDCLYTRDEKVIAKSTSLLTPADVLKLLKSIILMIQSRGAVLVCVIPWLRSLLGQHASSIVSQESSLLLLNSLYQLIDSRISTFGSALQLSTCLDYLFVGIPDGEADEEAVVPPIIYEDKDSEEEESEDAMETD